MHCYTWESVHLLTLSYETMSSLDATTRNRRKCLWITSIMFVLSWAFFLINRFANPYVFLALESWSIFRHRCKYILENRNLTFRSYRFIPFHRLLVSTSKEVHGRLKAANQRGCESFPHNACWQYKQCYHDNLAILRIF